MKFFYQTITLVIILNIGFSSNVWSQCSPPTTCSWPKTQSPFNIQPHTNICITPASTGVVCPGKSITIDPEDNLILPHNESFDWYITRSGMANQIGNSLNGVDPSSQMYPPNNPNFEYIGTSSTQIEEEYCDPTCEGSCPELLGILVDACGTGAIEGRNEFAVISTGCGFNASDLQFDFASQNNNPGGSENNDIQTGGNPCGLKVPDPILMQAISGSCDGNVIAIGPGQDVPEGGIAILFTSNQVQTAYDFSGSCECGQTIYVMQSACTRTAGAFSNSTSSGLRTQFLRINGSPCSSSVIQYDTDNLGGDGSMVYYNEQGLVYGNGQCAAPPVQNIPLPPVLSTTAPFTYTLPLEGMCDVNPAAPNAPNFFYIIGVLKGQAGECGDPDRAAVTKAFRFEVRCEDIETTEPDMPCEGGDPIRLKDLIVSNVSIDFITDEAQNLITNTNFAHNPTEAGTYPYTIYFNNGSVCYEPLEIIIEVAEAAEVQLQAGNDCADASDYDLNNLLIVPNTVGTWEIDGTQVATTQNSEINLADYPNINELEVTFVPDADEACVQPSSTMLTLDPPPSLAFTGDAEIACGESSTTITSTPSESGLTYNWEGENAFSSSDAEPEVTETGTYMVTLTNSNGCTATASTDVIVSSNNAPEATIATPDNITCRNNGEITLTVNSSTSGVNFSWSDPDGVITGSGTSINVNEPGEYTVTVSDADGCSSTSSVMVTADNSAPTASGTPIETKDCKNNGQVFLDGTGSDTGNHTYAWTGPNIVKDGNTLTPVVDQAGVYTLTVTDNDNGCTSIFEVTVEEEITPPENVIASATNNSTLDCTNNNLQLMGSSTSNSISYLWSSTNGFSSSEQNPTISAPGEYTLIVTSADNGCTATDNITIDEENDLPSVNLTPGTLNCDNSITSISSTTNDDIVNYQWTGDNGYTFNGAMPNNITESGTYTLIITASNNCTSTATAFVANDMTPPDVSASALNNVMELNCNNGQAILQGNTTTPNTTLTWNTGDSNNTTVAAAGTYTLTATFADNGCTATEVISITENFMPPTITTDTGATLDCNTMAAILSASGGDTYQWSNNTNNSSISVSDNNTYMVTVSGANGCTSTASLSANSNYDTPIITDIAGATVTCANPMAQLSATSNDNVTYEWTDANGQNYTGSNPVVDGSGTYTLTITSLDNGCTASNTAEVMEDADLPVIALNAGADLDCGNMMTSISVTDNNDIQSYTWTGPNGYTFDGQNPNNIAESGMYTLEVVGDNQCPNTATITINSNIINPDLNLIAENNLTTVDCNNPMTNLQATSTTPNVTYTWDDGTTNVDNMVAAGTYTVTITDPVNQCSSEAMIVIGEDFTLPNITTDTGATLDCDTEEAILTASGGDTYQWSNNSNDASIMVSDDNIYMVTVTATNGCTSTASLSANTDYSTPIITDIQGATVTCANPIAQLSASSNDNVTYEWSGVNGQNYTGSNPTVDGSGMYSLLITSLNNGCTAMSTTAVVTDDDLPEISLNAGADLDCANMTTSISVTDNNDIQSYTWTGPNGYTFDGQNPNNIAESGMYTLEVVGDNQCPNTATITINSNTTNPDLNLIAENNLTTVDCNNPMTNLQATSTTPNVTYTWDDGTTNVDNMVAAGTYTVTITDPVNQCSSEATIVIGEDFEAPTITTDIGETLDCDTNEANLTVSGGVSYIWSDNSTTPSIAVDNSDPYGVTVTGDNGCTSMASLSANSNYDTPTIESINGDIITCTQTMAELTATSNDNVSYEWTGNNQTYNEQSPTVDGADDYTLIITSLDNGCTATAMASVTVDDDLPAVMLSSGILTCENETTTITTTTTDDITAYNWTAPSGITFTGENPNTINETGIYTLMVTAANECTATVTIDIAIDTISPNLSIDSGNTELNCNNNIVLLQGNSTTPNAAISWENSGSNSIGVTEEGTYNLVVSDPNNGCTTEQAITVTEDFTLPTAMIAPVENLDCDTDEVNLIASGGSTYEWQTGVTTSNFEASQAGEYTVTVTAANGCNTTTSITVIEDNAEPNITAINASTITCTETTAQLTSSSNDNVSYAWTDSNNMLISTEQAPTVEGAGIYTLTITSLDNACTTSQTTEVIADDDFPQVALLAEELDCLTTSTDIITTTDDVNSDYTYSWEGPNGFASTSANLSDLAMAGAYTLTTSATNNCVTIETIMITIDTIRPDLNIVTSNGEHLDCTTTSTLIEGLSTVTGISYEWTTPNGSSQASTVPVGQADEGIYTLTITAANNCTAQEGITITSDTEIPAITTNVSENLDCGTPEVDVIAAGGITYEWITPNNETISGDTLIATDAGNYTVTVTADNGCTNTATLEVIGDYAIPQATAGGGTIDCIQTEVQLEGMITSDLTNLVYYWNGPAGYDSEDLNPTVTETGDYSLWVTDTINECSNVAFTTVIDNVDYPNSGQADYGGVFPLLTCNQPALPVMGTHQDDAMELTWLDQNGNPIADSDIIITSAGTYTLLATDPTNGCSSESTLGILEDFTPPEISTINSGDILDCNNLTTNLSLESPNNTISYEWEGTDFLSEEESPLVDMGGEYTVTITAANNGCTATETLTVEQNTTPPAINVNLSNFLLTCDIETITVDGTSTTLDATYEWTGMGINSNDASIDVSDPGAYNLVVSDPSNGCSDATTIEIGQNIIDPIAVIAQPNPITCNDPETTIDASASTTDTGGIAYSWNTANDIASIQVNNAGTYTVTVTDLGNGCTATATSMVDADTAEPIVAIANASDLTCTDQNITLDATASESGAAYTYLWTGSSTIIDETTLEPSISEAGIYTLNITGENGCIGTSAIEIMADQTNPTIAAAAPISTLDCENTNLTLEGAGSDTGVDITYNWLLNNNTISNDINTMIAVAGTYSLLVTNEINGCTAIENVVIDQNIIEPIADAGASQEITCTSTEATLDANASTGQGTLTYEWNDSNNNIGTDAAIVVNTAGVYTIIVTDSANACTNSATVTITEDTAEPTAIIEDPNVLNCQDLTTTLDASNSVGSAADSNITYLWDNNETSATISVAEAIAYNLTITDEQNGCTSISNISVTQDITPPSLILDTPATTTLTCENNSIDLNGFSANSDVVFAWEDANGTLNDNLQTLIASDAGTYTFIVTDNNNHCTATETITLDEDRDLPNITTTGGALNCEILTADLIGNSTTDNVNYEWTGPNNFTSTTSNITVDNEGAYILVVSADNGCTASSTEQVILNNAQPILAAVLSDTLNCALSEIVLDGTASTPPGDSITYNWTYNDVWVSSILSPVISNAGTYQLVGTHNTSQCTDTLLIDAVEDMTPPIADAGVDEELTCDKTEIILDASNSVGQGDLVYNWLVTIPDAQISGTDPTFAIDLAATVTLVVLDNSNFCTAEDTVIVTSNILEPLAIIQPIDIITCEETSVAVNAGASIPQTPNAMLNYEWTDSTGTIVSTAADFFAENIGVYNLVITDTENGCTNTAAVEVFDNVVLPTFNTAEAAPITCKDETVILEASSEDNNLNYLYEWTGSNTATILDNTTTMPTVDEAGDYTVIVTDLQNGCQDSLIVNVPIDTLSPVASIQALNVFDCTTDEVGLNGTGSSTGHHNYTWMGENIISDPAQFDITVDAIGLYELIVEDILNGCVDSNSIFVPGNENEIVDVIYEIENENCLGDENGSIGISANNIFGGTAPFMYSFDGGETFYDNGQQNNLAPGDYPVIVQDAEGCENLDTITVYQGNSVYVNIGENQQLSLGDVLDLNPSFGGVNTIEWEVIGADIDLIGNNPSIIPSSTLTINATVTDADGCTDFDQIMIFLDRTRDVFIPNAFSPNGDNNNDLFTIYGNRAIENIDVLTVYDRWGNMLYAQKDFQPEEGGWDGTFNGKIMNPAVYVYYAEIKFVDGITEIFKGDVSLMR